MITVAQERSDFETKLESLHDEAMEVTSGVRDQLQKIMMKNQKKVLSAFIEEKISEYHFYGTTGYGFSDSGRQALDNVFARIFKTEKAIVRHSMVSGTHALSAVLKGNLRPGQEILCATGDPYDTIKPVLGLDRSWEGGLHQWDISTQIAPLDPSGMPDIKTITEMTGSRTAMVYLQRSCGYTWHPSYPVSLLGEIIRAVKAVKPDVIVMVDNCYGEMVEEMEPTELGADVMGGSLIKNMGGAIAPTGGYIVGKEKVVARSADALTCAGIGGDEGATLGFNRLLFQGAFTAPLTVSQALEGAVFAAYVLEKLGFDTKPRWNEKRTDIIQGIRLGDVEKQKAFCRGIQEACPVDHMAIPEAAELPGYRDPIIMAGGTFIQGSSIELSCDGPIREPYAVYLQGGISFAHIRLGVMNALRHMKEKGLL